MKREDKELIKFEIELSCGRHTELKCICGIREQLDALRRRLGSNYEIAIDLLCASCEVEPQLPPPAPPGVVAPPPPPPGVEVEPWSCDLPPTEGSIEPSTPINE